MTTSATSGSAPISDVGLPKPRVTGSGQAYDPAEQKELFLKLLVAQLKNQDPTNPMDQKDFMGQMAQFSAVEQMTNVAKTLEAMMANSTFGQSVSLIGKTVDYLDVNGDLQHGAEVTGVSVAGGEAKLVLGNGTTIAPADVLTVR